MIEFFTSHVENGYYLGWRGMEFLIPACTVGHPKIRGIVKKNYLKYSYKFETFVPFKVLPL
jgi:hypothetical protein